MDCKKFGASALAATLTSAALGVAPHTVCDGRSEMIGCRHDGHIDQNEPEGPLRLAQTISANGSSTAMPVGDSTNLQFFFDDVLHSFDGIDMRDTPLTLRSTA